MRKFFLLLGFLLLFCVSKSWAQEPVIEEVIADTTAIQQAPPVDVSVLTLTADDIEGDADSHDISSLLQGSRDVFMNTAGYNFGSARFRVRGYDSENTIVMINGIPVNDPETGRAFYSTWGGLNDATRNTEGHNNLGYSRNTFGGLGGAVNIVTRASQYGENLRTTYSNSNRTYVHRAMFTYSTGLQDNGWAWTLSGSRRLANEGYVTGTFYDAWAYFLSGERKFSDQHSLGLIFLGSPSRTGRPGVSTQEAYDLAGDNFYNPNWGYQGGKIRNSRINNYHTPWAILSHYWSPIEAVKITTSAAYTFGRGGSTALNWYDSHASFDYPGFNLAGDPRPDYYRWMPSYYGNDPVTQNILNDLWQNDPYFRQINWEWLYNANYNNLFTVKNINDSGQDHTGLRSKYIIEERRTDRQQLIFNTNVTHQLQPSHTLSGGVNISLAKTHQFKVLEDLLGGQFWYDIDQFAERDFDDPDMSQNDLLNRNRIVQEGDIFGYDFTGNINEYQVFAQSDWVLPRWDFYVAASVSQTTFWRTGHMMNGRFPDNSYGEGQKHNFTNFGIKGGTTFKITGRHYVTGNGMFFTRAPYFRDAYISSRVRDDVIEGLTSETIFSGDVSYIIRTPKIKSRLSAFYTEFRDQTWSRSFYHEGFRSFVNYIMTGVDTRHMGLEFGMDINISSTLSGYIVAGTGDYIYNSRPNVTIARDNDKEVLADQRRVYLQNYKIGGMTHTAGSVGLRYNHPKFWFIGVNMNYFDDIYIDINPDRRTEDAVSSLVVSDPQWKQILNQEKMDNNYTFDVFAGYSYRTKKRHFITINLSISNLFNVTNFRIGGFEQLRYDSQEPDKFASKYFYLYGRTYFLNLAYRI